MIEFPKVFTTKRKKLAFASGHVSPDHIGPSSFRPSSSSGSLLSIGSKSFFDEGFSKILEESLTRESRIHAHIDVVAKEAKEIEEKIKEAAKASKENILVEISFVKGVLDHIQGSTLMFNLNDNEASLAPSSTNLS